MISKLAKGTACFFADNKIIEEEDSEVYAYGIEYNEKNLEMILFFYDIPEKLITRSEAESIVKALLTIEPDNKVALRILGN